MGTFHSLYELEVLCLVPLCIFRPYSSAWYIVSPQKWINFPLNEERLEKTTEWWRLWQTKVYGQANYCPVATQEIRDSGSIPGWGISPGEENGNPFQYSCLKNLMDRGAWWATVHGVSNSWTGLSNWHTHTQRNMDPVLIPTLGFIGLPILAILSSVFSSIACVVIFNCDF